MDSSEDSSSGFNPEEDEKEEESSSEGDGDETLQDKLKEKIIIFTQVPKYVYNSIDKNNKEPSELSMKIRTRLNVNSFTDFIERFKQEIEERKQYDGFEKFSGPVCGILSSQLKQVLCFDTIEDFIAPDSSEVRHKFENILIDRQRSNITSIIQIFGSLDPSLKLEHEFFVWMCNQMCRITVNYDEVCCDKNYKCVALVTRIEKKSQKKKKEKKYWLLLANDNILTVCDSQGEKEGEPIPVDLFSFSKIPEKSKKSKDAPKTDMYEMNIHQIPSTIKTKFNVDLENNKAFDRKLWEYDSLRARKVPFYRSLGYFETKYHPSYIEAAARCILHPLALILRTLFSYDDKLIPMLNPSQCNEVFKSFFDIYLSQERAHEMINVMVVEGLNHSILINNYERAKIENIKAPLFPMYGIEDAFIRNPANPGIPPQQGIGNSQSQANIGLQQSMASIGRIPTQSQIPAQDQNPGYQNAPVATNDFMTSINDSGHKSFLTFFAIWFLQRYSNNYFNRVICHIVNEIDLYPSLEEKNVDEAVNLIKYFVNTIYDNYDQISPQIHHFASVLQNFVIFKWDQKFYLYQILKEFFFDLYIYRMIKEPRFWDNKFTLPNQTKRTPEEIKETADKFIQMIDVLLSPDKRIEQEYEMFHNHVDVLQQLQEKMYQFIMRLPVLTLDHCYNQDVSALQQQNAIAFILMTISDNPDKFKELIKRQKSRLNKTPIIYSVAYFMRCLVSDKENYGLLDEGDRQVFIANYLKDNDSTTDRGQNYGGNEEEEEEEEELKLVVPKVEAKFPSSIQSIESSGTKVSQKGVKGLISGQNSITGRNKNTGLNRSGKRNDGRRPDRDESSASSRSGSSYSSIKKSRKGKDTQESYPELSSGSDENYSRKNLNKSGIKKKNIKITGDSDSPEYLSENSEEDEGDETPEKITKSSRNKFGSRSKVDSPVRSAKTSNSRNKMGDDASMRSSRSSRSGSKSNVDDESSTKSNRSSRSGSKSNVDDESSTRSNRSSRSNSRLDDDTSRSGKPSRKSSRTSVDDDETPKRTKPSKRGSKLNIDDDDDDDAPRSGKPSRKNSRINIDDDDDDDAPRSGRPSRKNSRINIDNDDDDDAPRSGKPSRKNSRINIDNDDDAPRSGKPSRKSSRINIDDDDSYSKQSESNSAKRRKRNSEASSSSSRRPKSNAKPPSDSDSDE